MKIFPGNHIVTVSEETTVNHIPLSYFKETETETIPYFVVEKEFCSTSKTEILYPYQQFDSDDYLFFDENDNAVSNSGEYLKRNGTKYYFEPINSTNFTPTEFNYCVLLIRNDSFKNNIDYNIKVGCYSDNLAESLIGLFNGASKNKPQNIKINDDGLLPSSLINMSYADADFLFIESQNLTDPDEYLDQHINLWIVGDDFENMLENEDIKNYILNQSQIYQNNTYTLDGYQKVNFDKLTEISKFPKDEYEYINLFKAECPILVLKKEDKGYVILSHSSILNSLDTCYNVIFEILMQIHLNSYFESKTRSNYISDNKIDYFLKMYKKFNQYHPRINLNDILIADNFNTDINYDIHRVILDREDIKYLGINKYKDMMFQKTSKTDPEKSSNSISVFTTKDTIINYELDKNVIKCIEEKLNISYKSIDDKDYLIIEPFRSSKEKIDLKYQETIEIPNEEEYVLYFSGEKFALVYSINYKKDIHGTKFATIKLEKSTELSCGDIRNIGGGESSSELNYEMIDTGSIKGRPYRLGSTMIIKIPKRFEKHKNKILLEIKKHMSSADYPILVFY